MVWTISSRKNFLFWRFLLYRETLGKNPETPLEPPQYCQYPLTLYVHVFYIIGGISTPNSAHVWKTAQFLPFTTLLFVVPASHLLYDWQINEVSVLGNAHLHGYHMCASQVLHTLTVTVNVPYGYCIPSLVLSLPKTIEFFLHPFERGSRYP